MRILFLSDVPLLKFGLADGFVRSNRFDEVKTMNVWGIPENDRATAVYDEIRGWKPQLVITEGFPGFSIIDVMSPAKRDLGQTFKLVYWAIEDYINYGQTLPTAKFADMVFTTVVEQIPKYKADADIDAYLLQFGVNPCFHRPTIMKKQYENDIVLCAVNYDKRYEQTYDILINPIIKKGYDFHVWGQWWDEPSRPYNLLATPEVMTMGADGKQIRAAYEELPSIYSSCKIALGVHQISDSVSQASMRTQEVMGCRCAYLTFETLYHTKNFQKGVHMEWSSSADETCRIIDDLLENENKRKQMALQGQQLVYSRDDYALRANHIKDIYIDKYDIFGEKAAAKVKLEKAQKEAKERSERIEKQKLTDKKASEVPQIKEKGE